MPSGIAKHDWLAQIRPRPRWRQALNLCVKGHRHDWEPVEFADFRCGYCGAWR
jgi:hypothetical protein